MSKPSRPFIAVLASLMVAGSAGAQAPAPSTTLPFTVEEAVQAALARNPGLRAAMRDVEAARSGLRSARALVNPEVVFTPALTDGGSDEEVLVRQPLEINGTRAARAGVARAQLQGRRAAARVTLQDLVFQVRSAYYEMARARELLSVSKDSLRTAEELDRITRRQVELGSRPGIEQVQTGIETARARRQVIQAEGQVAEAAAALNTLMGRPPGEALGPFAPLSDVPLSLDEESALTRALVNRPEIAAAESERDAFRQEARLARAEGRPDIAPQFRAGSVTRGVEETGFGVGITLPLLDWGGRRNRVRQAEAAARAQEDRTEAARNQVRQDVAQALARLRAADAVVRTYPDGVLEQARRLLEASRTGFQAGQTNVIALIEAQRTYRAVQNEYANALVDRALATAELERATGAIPADLLPSGEEAQGNQGSR